MLKRVFMMVFVALTFFAFMQGCSSDPAPESLATLEQQRDIVRENTMLNAQLFRSADARLSNYKIIPNGDSTQSPRCPQGDGWATLTLVDMAINDEKTIKCSTYSRSISCVYSQEFTKKSYAADDGKCQSIEKVPYPIPKIAN